MSPSVLFDPPWLHTCAPIVILIVCPQDYMTLPRGTDPARETVPEVLKAMSTAVYGPEMSLPVGPERR